MGQGLIDQCKALLPVTVLLLSNLYVQDRRVKVFWDRVISAQHLPAYHPSFAWLLELLLYSQWHYCSLSAAAKYCYKKHWSQVRTIEEFSNKSLGFFILLCFLNLMLICGDGDITWECTPLQEILTRKGLSSTGIWRHISTPVYGIDQWLGHLAGVMKTYSSSAPALH